MKLIIQTPEQLRSERDKLVQEAMDIIEQQERSCIRYCKRLCTIRNRLLRITRQIGQ